MRRHEIPDGADPDAAFDREWTRSLIALAVEDLRARWRDEGKEIPFAVFERYDVRGPDAESPPTYREIAEALGIPLTQVTNHLHAARRAFRATLLDRLRAMTASDAEFAAEARDLLGIDAR